MEQSIIIKNKQDSQKKGAKTSSWVPSRSHMMILFPIGGMDKDAMLNGGESVGTRCIASEKFY